MQQKSWFSRNWPWVVPLGGCLGFIIVILIFAGSLFYGVSEMFENSTPFEEALALAQENEEVQQYFGDAIETNGIFQGSLNFHNDEGDVDLKVPIKGSKNEGKLWVKGSKSDGVWTYEILQLITKDQNDTINIID